MNYKDEYISLFKTHIKREGAEKLLDYLTKSDFFVAPASSRYHSNHEGGLCEHCVKVFYRFMQNLDMEYAEERETVIPDESVAIIALLHDICKVDTYKTEFRNQKQDGVWVSVPYYTVDDRLPFGHGEKSVYMLSSFIRLTREEAMAINWHMGAFDFRVMGGSNALSQVFTLHPISLLFHISDLQSTYLDE